MTPDREKDHEMEIRMERLRQKRVERIAITAIILIVISALVLLLFLIRLNKAWSNIFNTIVSERGLYAVFESVWLLAMEYLKGFFLIVLSMVLSLLGARCARGAEDYGYNKTGARAIRIVGDVIFAVDILIVLWRVFVFICSQ